MVTVKDMNFCMHCITFRILILSSVSCSCNFFSKKDSQDLIHTRIPLRIYDFSSIHKGKWEMEHCFNSMSVANVDVGTVGN